jgi:hypothetical protein
MQKWEKKQEETLSDVIILNGHLFTGLVDRVMALNNRILFRLENVYVGL